MPDYDFSFIEDDITRENIINGVATLNKTELWDFVRNFQPGMGFAWSVNPTVTRIFEAMEECIYPPGHCGSSFGIVMRHLQCIAKEGYESYKQDILIRQAEARHPPVIETMERDI